MVAGLAGSATACINDRELPSHEREFRSSYLFASSNTPPSPGPTGVIVGPVSRDALVVGGAVLLVGGVVLAAKGGNRAGR
jgi:hypothetical protein